MFRSRRMNWIRTIVISDSVYMGAVNMNYVAIGIIVIIIVSCIVFFNKANRAYEEKSSIKMGFTQTLIAIAGLAITGLALFFTIKQSDISIFSKSGKGAHKSEDSLTSDDGLVSFGSYEQDNNIDNGKEELKWIVLCEKGDQRLLVTAQVIDAFRYNSVWEETTWKSSSLRAWLRKDFMDEAFTEEEKQRIVEKDRTDKNGIESTDTVFVMNVDELNEYWESKEDRKTSATDYALARGVYECLDHCWWWVSDQGETSPFYAAYVNCIGDILENGMLVFCSDFGVRPAVWIR